MAMLDQSDWRRRIYIVQASPWPITVPWLAHLEMGYSLAQEAKVTIKIILAVFEIMTLSVQMIGHFVG